MKHDLSPTALLARKLAIAFVVAFGGIFLPAALDLLDKVASGAPTNFSTALVWSLVAGSVAAGIRAVLALGPVNFVPSDALHTLSPQKPDPIESQPFWYEPGSSTGTLTHVRIVPSERAHVSRQIPELVGPGRLGRHVDHDPRSRSFPVTAPAAPLRKVLWARSGAPLNQGNLGSCTGNAITGVLNTKPFHKTGMKLLTEKDAIAIYEAATIIDGFPGQYPPDDTGSSGLAVCKAAKARGLISGYQHAFSVAQALTALQHGPVITGVNWYEGFDRPDTNGLVAISGSVRGGHEFEILGYDPATDLVTAENSWGTGWGVKGRFFFTSKTWAQLLAEQGDVTVPIPNTAAASS